MIPRMGQALMATRSGMNNSLAFFMVQEFYMIIVGVFTSIMFGCMGVKSTPNTSEGLSALFICFLLDGLIKTGVSVVVLVFFNIGWAHGFIYNAADKMKKWNTVTIVPVAVGVHIAFDSTQSAFGLYMTNIANCVAGSRSLSNFFSCCGLVKKIAFKFEDCLYEGVLIPTFYEFIRSESDPVKREGLNRGLKNSLAMRAHLQSLAQ